MLSLDALYAGTFAVASRATDHLGPLGGLADRLTDRVLPQAVAGAVCKCPWLCDYWTRCSKCECDNRVLSCGKWCHGGTNKECYRHCYCSSTSC